MPEIEVGTRLHFGLLDVGSATARVFGGSGMALATPSLRVAWSGASRGGLQIRNLASADVRAEVAVGRALERMLSVARDISGCVTFVSTPPQHVGLGVTTALVLGALHLVNSVEALGFSADDLKRFSGRGGASGIGLGTFFDGGFNIDAGRARSGGQIDFLPSGAEEPTQVALRVARLTVEDSWAVRLFLPEGLSWSGLDEIEFFRANTPIPNSEVLESIALTYHGVLPSIASGDLPGLKASLIGLNRVGFKAREIDGQGHRVRAILDRLADASPVASGMSSMGPLVYTIGPRDLVESTDLESILAGSALDLGVHAVRHHGPPMLQESA